MRHSRRNARWLLAIVVIAAAAVLIWTFYPREDAPTADDGTRRAESEKEGPKEQTAPNGRPEPKEPPAPAGNSDEPKLGGAEATEAYRRGMALMKKNQPVPARNELNRAYYSGKLSPNAQEEVRSALTELADITLIGRRTTVYPGDKYARFYHFQLGEVFSGVNGVERRLKLHVPWRIIRRINGLERAADIQAGQAYKMLYGPFHAIVYKNTFTMDIHLHREGWEKVFIKRLRVGIGKDGSTPVGKWRVRLGGKHERATWYPPPNSEFSGPVRYGQANYAFGRKGLWINLEGLEEKNRNWMDYGIHSTGDPSSIGTAKSLGCIRLADDDIELVYSLLYEHWSTVDVRP